ncbi:hypothetical protein [Streptomonospora wellingtoniae]|uniref:Uncharacterized protein n=1 Tax=Streptomonospora wellingtoniae TaxID=3075544 RepID=A0ABU2KQI7_9ACTN|nr:hypothetical protein [Streptomonospora sp. DSM 45055]MDT0301546.1 hypothetical protein [Streptomonospora sp. DSM 45055]
MTYSSDCYHRPDEAHADALYDTLSEALKERGRSPAQRARAQDNADAAFSVLDMWLRSGGALPAPWRRCPVPEGPGSGGER